MLLIIAKKGNRRRRRQSQTILDMRRIIQSTFEWILANFQVPYELRIDLMFMLKKIQFIFKINNSLEWDGKSIHNII